ncbi:hypothetical protein [Haloarcula marina]|uniref:hypothetical protein n=1 Tax=Haloarcula marina TaxID=2961574 RepID=UPI0020B8A1C0|nr:hypothetical protein [Halomicroarcula marina]
MGREEKVQFLAIAAVSLFLLYVNRNAIEPLFGTFSTGEELLMWVGSFSIAYFTGSVSALREIQQKNGDRTRLAASLDDIAGVNITKIFNYGERVENYPASLNCLRKIKSYQVLAYFGGTLTFASVAVGFIYVMRETRLPNNTYVVIGWALIFLAEGSIIKMAFANYNAITAFVGSEGLDASLVRRSQWETFKLSLSNFFVGISFLALALFLISTLDNFSTIATYPNVLRGVHYLIVFASLTSGFGWIGTAIYQMFPHFSPKYADYELPDANEAFFTNVEQRPDGTFLFQTAEEDGGEENRRENC